MSAETQNKRGTRPGLSVSVAGPSVGRGRLSVVDLAHIIKNAQQGLQRVAQVLYGGSSVGRGRKPHDIELCCELFLVGWESGSAVAQLELGKPPEQFDLFGDLGERSLHALIEGMNSIAEGHVNPLKLPQGFDRGVLQTCDSMGRVLDHGIETIEFRGTNGKTASRTTFDRQTRDTLRELLGRSIDAGEMVKTGRLEELNGHNELRGTLWEPCGTKWRCHFKKEHIAELPRAWMQTVKVVGKAITDDRKENRLDVDSFVVLEDQMSESDSEERAPFWKSLSLEELAEEQGVSPVTDLDQLSDLWPLDDDPDELLSHILLERSARRSASERRKH